MPSGPAASQSRSVWSSSSSRWVRQESSLMTAAYCPRPGRHPGTARHPLPGAVGPRTRPAALELPDLGPHVGEIDGGRDEGDDREDRQWRRAVGDAGQANDAGHAEDDQPERLGLLTRRGKRGGGPANGVDEGPHLDDQGRQPERLEEPGERGHNSSGEHPSRLSGPGTIWAASADTAAAAAGPVPGGAAWRDPPGVTRGSGPAGPLLALVAWPAVERALARAGAAPVEGLLPALGQLVVLGRRARARGADISARAAGQRAHRGLVAPPGKPGGQLPQRFRGEYAGSCRGVHGLAVGKLAHLGPDINGAIHYRSHSPWPERAGLLGWCAGACAPELFWSVPSAPSPALPRPALPVPVPTPPAPSAPTPSRPAPPRPVPAACGPGPGSAAPPPAAAVPGACASSAVS